MIVEREYPDIVAGAVVERLERTLNDAAKAIERDQPWNFGEVTVMLVSTARIIELHGRYLDDPTPTDIITFPYSEPATAATVDGDIAICLDVVKEQASEAGVPFERELAFVGVHGLLHLAGWDDLTEADRAAMHARQDEILEEVCVDDGG